MTKVTSSYLSLPFIGTLEPTKKLDDIIREVALHNLTSQDGTTKKIDRSKISLFSLENLIIDLKAHFFDYFEHLQTPLLTLGLAACAAIGIQQIIKSKNFEISLLEKEYFDGKKTKFVTHYRIGNINYGQYLPWNEQDFIDAKNLINNQYAIIIFLVGAYACLFLALLAQEACDSFYKLLDEVKKNWDNFENPFVTKSSVLSEEKINYTIDTLLNDKNGDGDLLDKISGDFIPQAEVLNPRYIKIANSVFTLKSALNLLIQNDLSSLKIDIDSKDIHFDKDATESLIKSVAGILQIEESKLSKVLLESSLSSKKEKVMNLIKQDDILDCEIRINASSSFTLRDILA